MHVDLYGTLVAFLSSTMSRGDVHTPDVDLVLVFRAAAAPAAGTSKDAIKKDAEQAEREYTRLLDTIKAAGLRATGKRGQKNGQILVFIWASTEKLARLVKRERSASFIPFFRLCPQCTQVHRFPPGSPCVPSTVLRRLNTIQRPHRCL